MKNRFVTFIATASLVLFAAAGCSNNNIDTAKVRTELQSIAPEQKVILERGLAAIDAGKFKDALQPLRQVAFGAKLDKQQSAILRDTMGKLQTKIAEKQ